MTRWNASALALLAFGASAAGAEQPRAEAQRQQIIIREQMTVRIRPRPPTPDAPIEWRERRGPECIAADEVAAAALIGQDSVDILLRDNRRVRVRLDRCPALDFYRGFYIRPHADRRICAGRDVIRSRMGGQCEIEAFSALRPKRGD